MKKQCPSCCMPQEYTPEINVHQQCRYCPTGCLCGNYCLLDDATRQEIRENWHGAGSPPAGLMVEKDAGAQTRSEAAR